ncbi:MAG: cation:H+ antiporter [Saprospiraceae bacterium]|jgi:cation:H+ antiporter
MILQIALIILGFLLLIFGANWLVSGASALAKRYNISDLVIGLTVVAFGTSAPELFVNGIASSNGLSDIVYGNILGSNMFNLFFILGIVGLIMPISVQTNTVWKEIPISALALLVLLLLSNNLYVHDGTQLSRSDGLILLVCFAGFLWYVYHQIINATEMSTENVSAVPMTTARITILIFLGLIGMILGGKLVVDNAVLVATELDISEKIIGLTIVAAGTSLPELVTSIVAAFKKNSDIAIGNVLGSNIFNVLLILPISSMIHPITYNTLFDRDILLILGGTVFLFAAMFMSGRKKLDRWEAAVLLFTYLIYTGWLISMEM